MADSHAHRARRFADLAAIEAFAASPTPQLASPWLTIDQATIDAFAEATGDRQWIHVDPARAARESPFGTTVAHGFLTLSLLSRMLEETLVIESATMGVNYGFDRVRFVSPVPVGSRVRGVFALGAIERASTGARIAWDVTVELDGASKPALVARWIAVVTTGV